MTPTYQLYQAQLERANETMQRLLKNKEQIDHNLIITPYNPSLHDQLRTSNLEIKITTNEIENIENILKEFELENDIQNSNSL
ncbi:hypothetical protein [Flavobacterium muglaense]|uniref:Uncharacterized protein n=1 Tax=Flavobacterium muglaense TaxID=2764716 RepID=A0A923SFK0_9FLAO|nr:hypothetical protein [Flavobacterium muglaense]MBC5838142.1 hypothetical protein [Flavobacterium muglaense]MBC5844676.1 hypothetical protein [Flavobacterium muglaense]